MGGYMSLEEQVDADFSRARRRALLRKVRIRLRRDTASDELLLCFDDLRNFPGALWRIYRGIRTVPVAQIGGSVGRCSEFDGDFMPTKASVEERWKRIDRAFHRGEVLPPVSLYKFGGFYFVLLTISKLSLSVIIAGDPYRKKPERCPKIQTKRSPFPPSGECQTSCGRSSNRSSKSRIRPRAPAALAWTSVPLWTRSSSGRE